MWPLLLVAGFIGGTVAWVANEDKKAREERERRRGMVYEFDDGFTEEEFEEAVRKSAKTIKRIEYIEVEWPDVYGRVRSNSGITSWTFHLDFNDYGKCTGKCWMDSENDDSQIPDTLKTRIIDALNDIINEKELEAINELDDTEEHYCTNCGAILDEQEGFDPDGATWICKKCGQQLLGDNPNSDVFGDVVWYCDGCGSILNKQEGFTETSGSWTCSKCGFVNDVTINNIRKEKGFS